ncbi:hypothetical protein Tco_0743677 [Tanacetum coccineum]
MGQRVTGSTGFPWSVDQDQDQLLSGFVSSEVTSDVSVKLQSSYDRGEWPEVSGLVQRQVSEGFKLGRLTLVVSCYNEFRSSTIVVSAGVPEDLWLAFEFMVEPCVFEFKPDEIKASPEVEIMDLSE